MPQEMYEERLRAAKPEVFAWERQESDSVSLADLDEIRIRGAVRLGVERGRMPATAEAVSLTRRAWVHRYKDHVHGCSGHASS